MNDKKILFFDIDGTLLTPHPFKVPESTSRALTKAHENGHLLFINTGRTKVMMPSAPVSYTHLHLTEETPVQQLNSVLPYQETILEKMCIRDRFYGAPTVIIVFSDSKMGTCVENGSLVMGNLMNAAHALGVDSCWIHRAREVFDSEEGKELKKQWGVPEEYIGVGHCVLAVSYTHLDVYKRQCLLWSPPNGLRREDIPD